MSSKRKALNSPDYASTPEPQSKRSRKQNNVSTPTLMFTIAPALQQYLPVFRITTITLRRAGRVRDEHAQCTSYIALESSTEAYTSR